MKITNHLFFLLAFILSNFIPVNSMSTERPGMAVFEISKVRSMRLTTAALKNIEVKTKNISHTNEQSVPNTSIVRFQDQIGIYRLRKGQFKLIPIKIIKINKSTTLIQSTEIQINDELVIEGAELMRVAEMDAFGSGE